MKRGKFNIIIGAQAGSEAKGKLSAFLADHHQPAALFMAASPNAGHTVVINGHKYVTYHLPVSAVVTDSSVPIILGPSSLINPSIFAAELAKCDINPSRIFIDRRAIVITDAMLESERNKCFSDFGSTLQGIGAARKAKIDRGKGLALVPAYCDQTLGSISGLNFNINTPALVNSIMDGGGTIQAEMTQGFDLCLEHGIHPLYCTSKMIHPAAYMAEAGVGPKMVGDIYGVMRPFPIRVNNRTGSSGPYEGSEEITWADVAAECGYPGNWEEFAEITTTTKLPRRVFTFSWIRLNRFVEVCRPDYLCLQFANYLDWGDFGRKHWSELSTKTQAFVAEMERMSGVKVSHIGTGPEHEHMVVE